MGLTRTCVPSLVAQLMIVSELVAKEKKKHKDRDFVYYSKI